MKISIVFFAIAVLYVSASPLAETPSVRGPSQSCKNAWSATVLGLPSVTTVAKGKLAAVALMEMLKLSYWFTSSTASLQFNIDAGAVLGTAISGQMLLGYPASQVTIIQGYFATAITHMEFSVQAVMAVSASQGQAMQAQLTTIQSQITTVITQMQTVAATANVFLSLMMIISDETLTQLTATVQAVAQLQNDCGVSYSDANSATNIPALLMDIVIATTSAAKEVAAAVVTTTVATSVSVTQTTVQSVTMIQTTAMQQTSSVAEVTMTTVSEAASAGYAILITEMYLQQEFDVTIVVSGAAELEEANDAATAETVANITETNAEFSEMCSDSADADEVSTTANDMTVQITVIMQSQSSLTVQMCASVAIAAILVEQTKGHNGIGQCVSEGKNKNDEDMMDIQQNYTACAQENQQGLTNCANKYKDPNYSGKSAKNTDSGNNKDEMMESCKRKHCDKDMKKHKHNKEEKCKKHKKGGENYEKVKKCKEDRKTESVTAITAVYAEFEVCASVSSG